MESCFHILSTFADIFNNLQTAAIICRYVQTNYKNMQTNANKYK